MKKIKEMKEINLALILIVVYVVLMSVCENLGAGLETPSAVTAPAAVVLSAVVCFLVSKLGRWSYYGFNSLKNIPMAKVLFLLPMIVLATLNLWNGFMNHNTLAENVLYIIFMLFVGFLEEIIFRGFLMRALMKENVVKAIVISSVTFGLGHIVNLLNGAELASTLLQLVYAIAIGFMLSVFTVKTNNIIPCIIFHGLFNALGVFSNTENTTFGYEIVLCLVITAVCGAYALWMYKKIPTPANVSAE